jgi:chromosome segregation ATPase
MGALAEQEKDLAGIARGIDGVSQRFEGLLAQSDELAGRQLAVDRLHEQLTDVDALARKTASQADWLRQGREDVEALRRDLLEFQHFRADAGELGTDLSACRQELQAFGERMTAVSARAPELEATVDGILARVSLVEGASQRAVRLEELLSTVDGQVARLEARASLVETIERRLNGLNALSTEIDRKLEQQLDRRTDVDRLKIAADGIAAQIADAHHRIEALNALQARFLPIAERVRALEIDLDSTRGRLHEINSDGAAVTELAERYAELMETSRRLASELGQRTHDMQSLSDQLARSETIKNELRGDLEVVQSRQRETIGQTQVCEDQLLRVERMFKQLEERRAVITVGERKLVGVEARLADLQQVSDDLDRRQEAIASREQLVSAIKQEVETIHLISARSRADLDYLSQHRGEVSALKVQVDHLLARIADTSQQIVAIDARRTILDEVETKTSGIVDLLDDVRIKVETIEEQKALVDQVAQTVAQLEFRLQEGRRTIGTLQHERELAERLEQALRQLSLKAGRMDDVKTTG